VAVTGSKRFGENITSFTLAENEKRNYEIVLLWWWYIVACA
jgi:hypothetical protein